MFFLCSSDIFWYYNSERYWCTSRLFFMAHFPLGPLRSFYFVSDLQVQEFTPLPITATQLTVHSFVGQLPKVIIYQMPILE